MRRGTTERVRVLGLAVLLVAMVGCDSSGGAADGGPTGSDDTAGADATAGEDVLLEDGAPLPGDAADHPDGGGGTTDTPVGTDTGAGGCLYNFECPAEAPVCRDGECVGPCPDTPCPEDWTCVPDAGICIHDCLTNEDCKAQEGYWCEGSRCVAGCTWHECPNLAPCDAVTGYCAQDFCQWEVQPQSHAIYLGEANPEGMELALRMSVFQFKPAPATINVTLAEGSDPAIQIGAASIAAGGEPVEATLPAEVPPGAALIVGVGAFPEDLHGVYGELVIDAGGAAMCGDTSRVAALASGTADCITTQPATLDAGDVAWGDVAKRAIRLRSTCDNAVHIQRVLFLQKPVDWKPVRDYAGAEIPPRGTLDLEVFIAPTIPAVRNTKMFIVTDDPKNRVLLVTLNGKGVMEPEED